MRNWKQWFGNFFFFFFLGGGGGVNKVHFGPCENGQLPSRVTDLL